MDAYAIDLGGSHAACALVRDASVVAVERIEVAGARLLAPLLVEFARALRGFGGAPAGVAMALPVIADTASGRVLSAPKDKYEDACGLSLADWAREEFGLPVAVDNDARVALLGERYAGAARGFDDVVMVTLGTGVGGAAMIGGRLVRGKHFQAGMLGGHIPARVGGRRCVCGAVGCVEAEASGWALPAICRHWPGFASSALAAQPLDFASLFRLAPGDRVAREVRDHCLEVWAAGITGLIHCFDPEVVVVGGAVMGSAAQILPFLEDYVHRHAWTPWGKVRVCAAELGGQPALLGAVPLLEGAC